MTFWRTGRAWGVLAAVFLFLAFTQARSSRFSPNEAWFASPALNLIHKGFLGTTILESAGTWMAGLERRTYWVPPAHLLLQSACYKLFGFSPLTLRSISIFWSCVTLVSMGAILWKLCGRRDVTWLALALLAVDGSFLKCSASGRMDAMCAGLGFASWALYLYARERALGKAVLASHSLAAISCLTHPCGVLYAGGLAILGLVFDRPRLGWRYLLAVCLPYAVGLSAWGIYILQDPISFYRQFTGNISGIAAEHTQSSRWSGLLNPLSAFLREYFQRYGRPYGWREQGFTFKRLLSPVLVAYTLGIAGALCSRAVRRDSGPRVLLFLGAFVFCVLALFDGLKSQYYLVHTLPLCTALLAVFAAHIASMGGRLRRGTVFAGVAILMGLQLAVLALNPSLQAKRRDYASTIEYLRSHASRSATIIGPAELAFDWGFDSNLMDDFRLGYHTGRKPDFIVANPFYRSWYQRSYVLHPEVHAHIKQMLASGYVMVQENPSYWIYRRR